MYPLLLGITRWRFPLHFLTDESKSQNNTNSENGHLVFLVFKKNQENNGVGDISSFFQRHCQTNRLYYKQAVL